MRTYGRVALHRRQPWACAGQRLRSALHGSEEEDLLRNAYRVLLGNGQDHDKQVTEAQTLAVDAARLGYSVFLHLPTGAGKSLAFQAPALLAPPHKTTLVVSPLIALMHDQVSALRGKGVQAVHVSSADSKAKPLAQQLSAPVPRMIYTTPEFLLQNSTMQAWVRQAASENRIDRVVLDEAHCVLEWGSSFRPSYLEVCQWKVRHLSGVPVTLATASVSDDAIARLADLFRVQLCSGVGAAAASEAHDSMVLVQQVTDRPNLRLEVIRKSKHAPAKQIAARVQQAPTIVYCLTRNQAEQVCLALVREGCHAGVYHGGLPRRRREFVQKQWMGGQLSVMCATSAFGMGIDRPDVRFVVHYSLPLSLASYSQQIGRAGRDGQPSVCLLLYSEADKSLANAVTTDRSSADSLEPIQVSTGSSHAALEEVAAFCEAPGCRKETMFAHFGFDFDPDHCNRNCNCGPLPEECVEQFELDTDELEEAKARQQQQQDAEAQSSQRKGQVEYYYQKLLTETKRDRLPKRETLSRRVISDILENEPCSEDEMAAMRGVGPEKARRFFSLFRF